MTWEPVIGLEIHAQLATRAKIFSGAATAFGAEPNAQACAIDLALPGTLPVLNAEALRMAVMFGLAVNAEIGRVSVFDRKNYFYPDLPKGYQISQLHHPIVGPGHVDITLADGTQKRIGITRAHLEEDAGKSLHEDIHGMTGIDLNRAGTPLLEIVSEPDLRSAEEAVAYARAIHGLVTSLGICDGDMSQGSMRFDVNISVRPAGSDGFGQRTETKNLNSFRFMEDAIHREVERQINVLEDGGTVVQETRLYNGDTGESRALRSKEVANDYRYFPEPDLLPVVIDDAYIETVRAALPELPEARQARLTEQHGLTDRDAALLAADRTLADFFEAVVRQCHAPKPAANWILVELGARLNKAGLGIADSPVTAESLGMLIQRIEDGTISGKMAKAAFTDLWDTPDTSVDALIDAQGGGQISDTDALAAMVDDVIAGHPDQVAQYRASPPDKQKKLIGFFVGQVMKASRGKANPQQVNALLAERLAE